MMLSIMCNNHQSNGFVPFLASDLCIQEAKQKTINDSTNINAIFIYSFIFKIFLIDLFGKGKEMKRKKH